MKIGHTTDWGEIITKALESHVHGRLAPGRLVPKMFVSGRLAHGRLVAGNEDTSPLNASSPKCLPYRPIISTRLK